MCAAIDCGPLSIPQNAIINMTTTTFPSMAVYSCETGYDLNGPSTRMCQPDGNWSRLEISCTRKYDNWDTIFLQFLCYTLTL